jgi:hypothetical protein
MVLVLLAVEVTAELFRKLAVAEPLASTLKLTIPTIWSPLSDELTVPRAMVIEPLPPVEPAPISKALVEKSVEEYCKRADG